MEKKHIDNIYFSLIACFIIAIAIASCNKHDQSSGENGYNCITRLSPKVSDYGVSGADLDSIYALFSANNLSTADLQFQTWQTDTVMNVDPGAYNGYQEQVNANQFFNGLPVFADGKFFIFNAGKFQPGGIYDGYTGPAPTGDTIGHQALPALREDFLSHVAQSYVAGGAPSNSQPFIPSASTYVTACFDVTLGYLDAAMVPENPAAYGKELIKVWKVVPSKSSSFTYYPLVYVEDDNGLAWGVPTFIP
jgi:hypothetical protein